MIVLALCAEAAEDIVGYFKEYSQRQVVGASYQGPLDFLRNAAAQQWALNLGARSTG